MYEGVTKSKQRAVLYIVLAAFFFASMNLFVRLSGDVPTFEKSFFRNFIAFLFAFYIAKKEKLSFGKEHIKNLRYLLPRSIAGTLGILCNFYAVDRLVIADASMLNKLSPFFAIIFSFFLLKEKVRPFQLVCIIGAFIGVLFILKPGLGLFHTLPGWIGLLGGMAAGLAYTYVRLASKHGVPGPIIIAFFSGFSCVATGLLTIPFFVLPSIKQLIILVAAGLCAAGGQFAITAAYSHAPAREISIYDYMQIIFAAAWGILLLGEWPDHYSIIGYIIIFSFSAIMFFKQRGSVS